MSDVNIEENRVVEDAVHDQESSTLENKTNEELYEDIFQLLRDLALAPEQRIKEELWQGQQHAFNQVTSGLCLNQAMSEAILDKGLTPTGRALLNRIVTRSLRLAAELLANQADLLANLVSET